MRGDVSFEVAEHVLKRFTEMNAEPIRPYRIVTCPGRFPMGRRPFHDSMQVRADIQIRNGRMVVCSPAFKLQQWLASEALMRERWPKHHTVTIPAHLVDPIEVDRLEPPSLSWLFGRIRRRSKRK